MTQKEQKLVKKIHHHGNDSVQQTSKKSNNVEVDWASNESVALTGATAKGSRISGLQVGKTSNGAVCFIKHTSQCDRITFRNQLGGPGAQVLVK